MWVGKNDEASSSTAQKRGYGKKQKNKNEQTAPFSFPT
jgi:hypothetical protein